MLDSATAEAEQMPSEAAQTETHTIHLAVFAPATAVIILGIQRIRFGLSISITKAVSAENPIACCQRSGDQLRQMPQGVAEDAPFGSDHPWSGGLISPFASERCWMNQWPKPASAVWASACFIQTVATTNRKRDDHEEPNSSEDDCKRSGVRHGRGNRFRRSTQRAQRAHILLLRIEVQGEVRSQSSAVSG